MPKIRIRRVIRQSKSPNRPITVASATFKPAFSSIEKVRVSGKFENLMNNTHMTNLMGGMISTYMNETPIDHGES